jgi:hypothetical protein
MANLITRSLNMTTDAIDYSQGSDRPIVPEPYHLPFAYYSMQNISVNYLVDKCLVEEAIADQPEITPAIFGGDKALFSFNFQRYYAPLGTLGAITQEIEINALVFPTKDAGNLGKVTPQQYLLGQDTIRLFGDIRLFVPCDAKVAIGAGKALFGEPKILCTFDASLPDLNSPSIKSWKFDTYAGETSEPSADDLVFGCSVNTDGLEEQHGNLSPITLYGFRDDGLVGTRWNMFEVMPTYFMTEEQAQKAVTMEYGETDLTPTHGSDYERMRQTMIKMTKGVQPFAIRTFASKPCATVAQPYYP